MTAEVPGAACRLCGESRPLIKAHIIPQAFFTSQSAETMRLVSSVPDEHPKKAPVGPYDRGILCGPCDGNLGVWDEYGARFLLRELPLGTWLERDGRRAGLVVPEYDYPRLKLFFVSMLWRAGVSSLEFYRGVRLGPLEPQLRSRVLTQDPGDVDDYSVVLSLFTESDQPSSNLAFFMEPIWERWDGIRAYRFSLGPVMAVVKSDRRPFVGSFRNLALGPGRPAVAIARDFLDSPEAEAGRAIALKSHNLQFFGRQSARRRR